MQMRKLALVLLLAGMTSSVAQAEDATAKADTAIDTLQKVKTTVLSLWATVNLLFHSLIMIISRKL